MLRILLLSSLMLLSHQTLANKALAKSIKGDWKGCYYYADSTIPPVKFNLRAAQKGLRIQGGIIEENTFGESEDFFLESSFSGQVIGQDILFTKTYLSASGTEHSVEYEGVIFANNSHIEGTWSIPNSWSGAFQMNRSAYPCEN